MSTDDIRQFSRNVRRVEGDTNWDHVKIGALLRIADAVEKSTEYFDNMRRRMESAEAYNKTLLQERARQCKVIAGLRGALTRQRNQAEKRRMRALDTERE